jgi:DNA primase large subunit
MRRSSLDILEKSQLPEEQAKAILEVMDLELQSQRDELVTKDQFARELALFRAEVREQFFELRKELIDRLHAVELQLQVQLQAQLQAQRAEMARWILGSSGTLIGAIGVMFGIFYFFMSRLVK